MDLGWIWQPADHAHSPAPIRLQVLGQPQLLPVTLTQSNLTSRRRRPNLCAHASISHPESRSPRPSSCYYPSTQPHLESLCFIHIATGDARHPPPDPTDSFPFRVARPRPHPHVGRPRAITRPHVPSSPATTRSPRIALVDTIFNTRAPAFAPFRLSWPA